MVGAAARAQSAPPVDSTVNLDLGAGISGRQNNGGRAVVVRKVLRAVAVGQLVRLLLQCFISVGRLCPGFSRQPLPHNSTVFRSSIRRG